MDTFDLRDVRFIRRFSFNPYKSMRLTLGEMSCGRDWLLEADRGQPYPVTGQSGAALSESVSGNCYCVRNLSETDGTVSRLLGAHFPYATYRVTLQRLRGGCGVMLRSFASRLFVYAFSEGESVAVRWRFETETGETREGTLGTECESEKGASLLLSCRGCYFDAYWESSAGIRTLRILHIPEWQNILRYSVFIRAEASVCVLLPPGGEAKCRPCFYLDSCVGHADMKCMRYEDGTPIMENGRLYMTLSARMGAGAYQAVVSWLPSAAEMKLEGALFFDYGDDAWCSDMSASAVFDRKRQEWLVWAAAFSHGHILCHARAKGDLRFGIHVLDCTLMPAETLLPDAGDALTRMTGDLGAGRAVLSDDRLFMAKYGDEDPDLFFDTDTGKWLLAICRLTKTPEGKNAYRYFLFESDDPFEGYRYRGQTLSGDETGGSIVRVNGKKYLMCGSDFDRHSVYHLYELEDLSVCTEPVMIHPDGGWRGWGTLIPVPCGDRTRLVLMTFDRQRGSEYNWSYGNIVVFEADRMIRQDISGQDKTGGGRAGYVPIY